MSFAALREDSWEKVVAERDKAREAFAHSVRQLKSQVK